MNPDLAPGALLKPKKGTALMERKERRRDRRASEEKNKAIARKRDWKCRLPHCPYCQEFGKTQGALQVAHVIHAKGSGGDPEGIRSPHNLLMLLCPLAHAAQEAHDWVVDPLTDKGTDGPCAFWLVEDVMNVNSGRIEASRLLWARETGIGIPEHPAPLVRRRVIRKREEKD